MKKGQEITFTNLNSSIQLKQLNDVINYLLSVISGRFDLNSFYMQHICSKNVSCAVAGQWYDVTFDKTFYENPILFAYSADGAEVLLRQNPSSADMKNGVQVSFADTSKTGSINVAAIGKISLK